eukprot:TRINITY_DN57518_c0_g1_i1.p1 TRINITY_DN57518_c0_g1~~TRINITY_DN57518_c0_g1_i1.p1  ORF type:complete len:250 (-),score=39.64 TRINITY_DN57518_c0_g1_i1:136-861(-)
MEVTLACLGARLGTLIVEPSWKRADFLAAAQSAALFEEREFCTSRFILPSGTTWDAEQTVAQLGLSGGDVIQVVHQAVLPGTWKASNFPGTWGCIGRFCEVSLILAAEGTFELSLSGIYHDYENEFNRHDRGIFRGAWFVEPQRVILRDLERGGDGVASLEKEGIVEHTRFRCRQSCKEISVQALLDSVLDEPRLEARADAGEIVLQVCNSSPLQLQFRHTAGWTKEALLLEQERVDSADC